MTDKHKKFLTRQSVLSIYSAWEGFLKKSLQFYLQELNRLNLPYAEISDEYLAFQTDEICSFKNAKTNHETVKKISRRLFDMYNQTVSFETTINTESNANLKMTNALLKKLSLVTLSDQYDKELNKLLFFRNAMAHGDDGIRIEQADLENFSLLIHKLATDVSVSIVDGYSGHVYLKKI